MVRVEVEGRFRLYWPHCTTLKYYWMSQVSVPELILCPICKADVRLQVRAEISADLLRLLL